MVLILCQYTHFSLFLFMGSAKVTMFAIFLLFSPDHMCLTFSLATGTPVQYMWLECHHTAFFLPFCILPSFFHFFRASVTNLGCWYVSCGSMSLLVCSFHSHEKPSLLPPLQCPLIKINSNAFASISVLHF